MNKEQLEKYVRSFGLDEARARQELESRLQLLATLGLSEDKRFQLLVQGATLNFRTLQAFHRRTKMVNSKSRNRIFKLLES